jgi:hypothetical protein
VIVYSKKLIRIVEAWNGEEPDVVDVDLVRLFQRSSPMKNMTCREIYTVLLDLNKEPDTLLAMMKKDTRYEIRRAGEKEQLVYQWTNANDRTAYDSFCDYFDEFALRKGITAINRQWLSRMAQTKNLYLTRIEERSGETLVWHVYYLSGGRATLLYSASLFRSSSSSVYRNIVGRANRYHHWQDMMRFKAEGASTYDLGGWYQGDKDRERLSINRFKEEFGGVIVKNFICERGITMKGWLFIRLRQLVLGNAI